MAWNFKIKHCFLMRRRFTFLADEWSLSAQWVVVKMAFNSLNQLSRFLIATDKQVGYLPFNLTIVC